MAESKFRFNLKSSALTTISEVSALTTPYYFIEWSRGLALSEGWLRKDSDSRLDGGRYGLSVGVASGGTPYQTQRRPARNNMAAS